MRPDAERKAPGGVGQAAMDRDLEVHRLATRLRVLRRHGLDLCHHRGGVLFVGPHQPCLADVADVLPGLGEEGVQTCTLRGLLPEGAAATIEADPHVADLKSSAGMVQVIEPAVRLYGQPPTQGMTAETPWAHVWLDADDDGRDDEDQFDAYGLERGNAEDELRRSLLQDRDLTRTFRRAWPLLDAARQRLGDPEASRRRRRNQATVAALPGADPDLLAGPFAHIVVDEAQELTDAQWQMLLRRCPSRSLTIVGDRAQARHGFTGSWYERLERVGLDRIEVASLSINHRTPEEVMAEAEPVIRAPLPDANVPTSIRSNGLPVVHGSAANLDPILDAWLAAHAEGTACVVGAPTFAATSRARSLPPELSKGLEFGLVVLVGPEAFGQGIQGAVDRYVAMTRATRQLVVLTSP